jgi:hypothetical protein
MKFTGTRCKKKSVMFVDQVRTEDISHEGLEKGSSISYQSSEESITTPSKKFLSDQLEVLKKNLETIESSVEVQLHSLQAFNYAETDDLEKRIKLKLQVLNEEKKLKQHPGCCLNHCFLQ